MIRYYLLLLLSTVVRCMMTVYIVIDAIITNRPNSSNVPVIDSFKHIAESTIEQIILIPLKLEYIPGPTCLINCICCVEPIV